jgi:hypothetical protein
LLRETDAAVVADYADAVYERQYRRWAEVVFPEGELMMKYFSSQ